MSQLNKAQILEEIDIYDVYKKYIDVRNAVHGREGWITNVSSPFREDKNPSFTFNINHGGWKDFTGESGDLFSFIQTMEKTDFKGSLKYLQENYLRGNNKSSEPKPKIAKPKKEAEPIKDSVLRQYTKNLLDNIYPEASEVVFKRGITERVIQKYRIGINRYFYKKIGRDVDEVIIPFKFDDSGNAIEYKKIKYYKGSKAVEINLTDGTTTTEKLTAYTSGSAQLFPIDELNNDNLVLVEGELDALALISKGINAITGTAGAGTFTNTMAQSLTDKRVTILYDNDKAGILGTTKVIGKLCELTDELYELRWKYFEDITDGGFKVPDGYDVSEYFADGKELKHLKTALSNAVKIEVTSSDDGEEAPEEELTAEELADYIYVNVGSEKSPRYRLIHEKLVNHIITIKKICCSDIKNKVVFFEYKDGFWNAIERKEMQRYITTLLFYFTRSREIREITNLLADKTYVSPEVFNTQMHLVNLKNGAYDTRAMKMINHSPEHYFTFKNDYEFIADAKAPIFMNELKKYSLNDQEWMDVMGEIFGYCLTEDYPIQKMFWWFGGGRNGKGTLLRVLQKLIGSEYVLANLNPASLDGEFNKVDLKGKKMAYEGDMSTYLPNTHILKQLTGGDEIRSGQKFMGSVQFYNKAKIILAMNNMVQVHPGQSLTAIFRRIVLLPFEYQISEENEDSDIEDKFKKELPGIFNWAIESLKRLRKNKRFTICQRGDTIVRMHKSTVNAFMNFFDSKIVFEEGASIWSYDLWKEYSKFMEENYGRLWATGKNFDVIVSPYAFGKEINNQFSSDYPFLKSKGEYSREKGGKNTKYYGIRLITTQDIHERYGLSEYEDEEQDDVPF